MVSLGPPENGREEVEVTPELLWVLAGEWNRRVLRYFLESNQDEVGVEELADHVAEQAGTVPWANPNKVLLQLKHVALPKLADHDLIEYDPEAGIVRQRSDRVLPPQLEQYVLEMDE